ncbi:MAG: HlyD family efflux transporter periplasmic adaptor subunit [Propioniciclava sp.]
MTWANRLKLLGGILALTVLMCGLTLLFNQRQSRVASIAAEVEAPTASVGSGFPGVVINQQVVVGQEVNRGEELFVVSSPELLREVGRGLEPQSTDAYTLDLKAGTVTYHTIIDGQVQEIRAVNGSYVYPGASLATIASDSPKTVLAEFQLEPTDYGRVEKGAVVVLNLADDRQLVGSVSDIQVVMEGDQAITAVRIECDDLTDPAYSNLTRAGSPVQAVLTLRDDGILSGPTSAMKKFLVKIGLR